MLHSLIFTFKVLVIVGYSIAGIHLIDLAQTTTIADMSFNDWMICSIGGLFVLASMFALMVFSQIKR